MRPSSDNYAHSRYEPYNEGDEAGRIQHELDELKPKILAHNNVEMHRANLNSAMPLLSTLYFLLDEICDENPQIAQQMLQLDQYCPANLSEMLIEALQRSYGDFWGKLQTLGITHDVQAAILNRALHIAVESHNIDPKALTIVDNNDLIRDLLDLGADPANTTEYTGKNPAPQNTLSIASNKTGLDPVLIKLLANALPQPAY